MTNKIFYALTGLLITSSLSFSMDSALVSEDLSTLLTTSQVEMPSGDTTPIGTVVQEIVPVPAHLAHLPADVVSSLDELSRKNRFLKLDFADDKPEDHPETQANKLLREIVNETKLRSAYYIYSRVAHEAYQLGYDSPDAIKLLWNCGKSLRHTTTINPTEMVETVHVGLISDKITLYNLYLLQVSKALITTALRLAQDSSTYAHKVGEINTSLSQTEAHLTRTEKAVKKQIKQKAKEERALRLLEREAEERKRNERAHEAILAQIEKEKKEKEEAAALAKAQKEAIKSMSKKEKKALNKQKKKVAYETQKANNYGKTKSSVVKKTK